MTNHRSMTMRRAPFGGILAAALLVVAIMAVSPHGSVSAQEPGTERLCLTIAGPSPAAGWSAGSLEEALSQGRADVVLTADPAECPAIASGPADQTDPAELPPVEVVAAGLTGSDDGAGTWAAILRNPNSGWAASFMPVQVRILDESGGELESISSTVVLLPSQTSAISGRTSAGAKAAGIEVIVEPSAFAWRRTITSADVLEIADVETVQSAVFDAVTIGSVHNLSGQQLRDVLVTVAYVDTAGEIIGGGTTFLPFVLADGDAPFMIPHFGPLTLEEIDQTLASFQLFDAP